ncbi:MULTISPECIES: 30S ribosomal protein S6 [unclassified Candidatus Frackibacter]|uniref:30S ribosomal protein S6 n=1 Tax=unclassified Candidatus Frackibacter TaxID=2648818 RepID=UPI000795B911|nr:MULTISPECIES: 30S ribosomal protein S6 [unclassified Candidatus Frackibacter]KXS40104.1 MAG: small subunit ribosomal protein S6 [Candidatus Frackibacter sp. T328-2]SDC44292.1 SSU ribosomal protein S6P [Candidatus Frackibacter sp. WG11]SEM64461.1 SSU ribosomal protein S6P [Candidatus Frackibacter sp. WG12]SFL68164.1 SSU ribosomal protein S6P [Candidatus Frackibacter sp. WG13]
MRKYETVFIVNPDLDDEATEAVVEKILDTINNTKGEVVKADKWGTKKLAYEVQDYKAGYYTVVNFKGEAETVDELERVYRITDTILKFLILKDEE